MAIDSVNSGHTVNTRSKLYGKFDGQSYGGTSGHSAATDMGAGAGHAGGGRGFLRPFNK